MENEFLIVNPKTGEVDLDSQKVRDFLGGYLPGHEIAVNLYSLRLLGAGKLESIMNGQYDKNYDQVWLDSYASGLHQDTAWGHRRLSKEAVERHLIIAREFLGAIGGLVQLDDTGLSAV